MAIGAALCLARPAGAVWPDDLEPPFSPYDSARQQADDTMIGYDLGVTKGDSPFFDDHRCAALPEKIGTVPNYALLGSSLFSTNGANGNVQCNQTSLGNWYLRDNPSEPWRSRQDRGWLGNVLRERNLNRFSNFSDDILMGRGAGKINDISFSIGTDGDRLWRSTMAPSLGSLKFTFYRQEGVKTAGDDGIVFAVDACDANTVRSRFGPRLTRMQQIGTATIVPELFAGWTHGYQVENPRVSQFLDGITQFSIERSSVFRNAGYVGLGATLLPNRRTSLFTSYNAEFSETSYFQTVDIGMIISF
jgi:hypothetical protein